ncbi:hypothetical protein [Kribbella sp. NPDC051620]|uniref:hypothetical protein n=1 Tax=Kribbella sp. NPDC051620 TaxID=3364120 RepID=UPI0037928F23
MANRYYQPPVKHRPNVLFNLIGLLLIIAGIGTTIVGVLSIFAVMSDFDPFRGDGPPVKVADGAALAFWGLIVFTIGRYFWRGARTRGARDRFGRFLIICAYLLLGIALNQAVHAATGLWTASSSDGLTEAGVKVLVAMLVWSIPAAVLGTIGFKLANEKALLEVEMKADL